MTELFATTGNSVAHNALVSTAGQLFAGLNDGTIYVSHDLGNSWQALRLTGEALPGIMAMACVG